MSKRFTEIHQCMFCTRYRRGDTCAAFPDGIPPAILGNEHDHRPGAPGFPGDNGILFHSIDSKLPHLLGKLEDADNASESLG